MGAMRLPASTPEETGFGFVGAVAAGWPAVTCGPAGAAVLMPAGTDESVLPRSTTGSEGASTAGPVGWMRSRKRGVVRRAIGAAGALVAAAGRASRWMGGG